VNNHVVNHSSMKEDCGVVWEIKLGKPMKREMVHHDGDVRLSQLLWMFDERRSLEDVLAFELR